MKVLRTITSFFPCVTGPANQAYNISLRLEKKGIYSPIWTTFLETKNSPAFEIIDTVKVFRFKIQFNLMRYSISIGMIRGLLDDFDILHSHEYRAFTSDIGALISKLKKKPFVMHAHGNLLAYKLITQGYLQKLPYIMHDFLTFKEAARFADIIIVSSKQEYREAIDFGLSKKKLRIIPVGIDIDKYSINRKIDNDGKLRLLFVGRISPDRYLEPILYALKEIDDNVFFYIVGPEAKRTGTSKSGYLKYLRLLVNNLGIQGKVEFVGPLYQKDLIDYYCNSDVFINTSKYENFGQAILEAAAAGLPIISTPVGVALDLVKDNTTGYIVNDSPQLISDKIKLMFDRGRRSEYSKNIKEIVKHSYCWNEIINQYINIYKNLL